MGRVVNIRTGRKGGDTSRYVRKMQQQFEMGYGAWEYRRSRAIEEGKKTMRVKLDDVVRDLQGEPIRKPGIPLSTWPVERLAKYHEKVDTTLEEYKKLAAEAHVMVNAKDAASMATIKFLCIESLCAVAAGENPGAEEKFKVYCLARKISECTEPEIDLTVTEVADIKARAGKLFQPPVMGPLWMALEAAAEKKEA